MILLGFPTRCLRWPVWKIFLRFRIQKASAEEPHIWDSETIEMPRLGGGSGVDEFSADQYIDLMRRWNNIHIPRPLAVEILKLECIYSLRTTARRTSDLLPAALESRRFSLEFMRHLVQTRQCTDDLPPDQDGREEIGAGL